MFKATGMQMCVSRLMMAAVPVASTMAPSVAAMTTWQA